MAAASAKSAPCTIVPERAHATVSARFARRYMRKDRNVVRIIRLTAVFFALMTPSTPRNGWCVPPIAASSSRSAIIVCGVAHTITPMMSTSSIHFVYGENRSPPGILPSPIQR